MAARTNGQIVIQVESVDVDTIDFVNKKTGEMNAMYRQDALCYGVQQFGIAPVRLSVPSPSERYDEGFYGADGGSFEIGRYGDLAMTFEGLKLVLLDEKDPGVVWARKLRSVIDGAT